MTDIDECKGENDICGKYGQCFNLIGSYSCQCKEGYVSSSVTKKCVGKCSWW